MKNIKILSIFLMLVIALASCEKDDYTGASSQTPTNPVITVDFGTIPNVTDGVNTSHKVILNMSEAQIVDVIVDVFVVSGTATQGEDFDIPSNVVIPAGRKSATFDVKFLKDDLPEDVETFTIQVGDEKIANASITPVQQEFSINNATSDDLDVELSWDREIYDVNGDLIDPTALADMRLLITTTDGTIISGADGSSFEAMTLASSDYPDGDYYIATDYYSAMDLGNQGAFDLDFTLTFGQMGVAFESFEFENLMNSVKAISNRANLVVLTKLGNTWTYKKYEIDLSTLVGEWGGTDGSYIDGFDWRFPSHISTYLSDDKLMIDSLNYEWMQLVWGETVLNYDSIQVNLKVDGTFTFDSQYHMTTLYGGSEYPYQAYGEGVWTNTTLTFTYELDQEGFLVAEWLFNNGYSNQPAFVADVTLAKSFSGANPSPTAISNKPY